jgi:hypothetical protein
VRPWRLRDKLRACLDAVAAKPAALPPRLNRALTICRPFKGANAIHPYAPPFGLAAYDDRFRATN